MPVKSPPPLVKRNTLLLHIILQAPRRQGALRQAVGLRGLGKIAFRRIWAPAEFRDLDGGPPGLSSAWIDFRALHGISAGKGRTETLWNVIKLVGFRAALLVTPAYLSHPRCYTTVWEFIRILMCATVPTYPQVGGHQEGGVQLTFLPPLWLCKIPTSAKWHAGRNDQHEAKLLISGKPLGPLPKIRITGNIPSWSPSQKTHATFKVQERKLSNFPQKLLSVLKTNEETE